MKNNIKVLSPTVCIDGKRHKWWHLESTTSTDLVEYVSWCEKCGSLTEFYREKNRLKKVRCKEINNQYTIEYPEWLKKE